ncbi:MAG TPA: nucleoside deaminase [Alphaproteobacteria bacterium]|jgi:tRNA(Arg) A34 adenosine deaminase TadA|nr:nucleoside deaminase [Alphaproteobacteria bacterium]
MTGKHEAFMARAIALSEQTSLIDKAGAPFGAVIAQEGKILAEGANRAFAETDPTWHAEMEAIRNACRVAGTLQLPSATLYASGEPCPMCLAAAGWAGIREIYYASGVDDILRYGGFGDSGFDGEVKIGSGENSIAFHRIMQAEAVEVWKKFQGKRSAPSK